MLKTNPEESLEENVRTSDTHGDQGDNWDEELFHAVRLRVGKLEEDPEEIRLSLIKAYLDEGANINVQDGNGDTVLHVAVEKDFRRIVELLLQRGAKTNIHNRNGQTAIALAKALQKNDIVRLLQKSVEQQNELELSRSLCAKDFESAADEQEPSSSRCGDIATKEKATTVEDVRKRIRPRDESDLSRHEDKAERVPCSGEQETYGAGGELTRAWPGIVYQWKHFAFTLNCALQREDPYFLLATEMVAAEKFDDVVLLYKNGSGEQVGRFVQIKYTSDHNQKIRANDLLEASGNFSVPKYFISWCKVKKNKQFCDIRVRNMILCTNMGLDLKDLKKRHINYESTEDPDKSFELKRVTNEVTQQTAWYKLSADKESNQELYRKLKETSALYRLAKQLAKCIYDKTPVRLGMPSIKDHHLALAKYVIDVKNKKFYDTFIQDGDLPKRVRKLREIFLAEFRIMAGISDVDSTEKSTWEDIKTRFRAPETKFGKASENATDSHTEYYLPDDHVDDAEITNFLEEFTLAVNQPNEADLKTILREKINANSGLNLLNTELLDGAFQSKMLNWFVKKDEHQKGQEYFSYKVGEKFFKDMNDEAGSLITIGINSVYCEQMKEYDVHFKAEIQAVKDFLTEDGSASIAERILELVAPEETLLTALWVYDTLGRIQKYDKMDSFIITCAESLKFPSILNSIKNTLDSLRYPDLLIVDFGSSNRQDQYLRTLWNSLRESIEQSVQKKMIVITRIGKHLGTQFKFGHETHREKIINVGFRDLTDATQKKLLEKPIAKFQGHKVETSLGELLDICKFDNLSADEFKVLLEIIDSNALVEIIRKDQLEIGNDLDAMDTIEHCYINRVVRRHIVIEEAILQDKKIPDLIAISGTNRVLPGASLAIGGTSSMEESFSADLFADSGADKDPPGKSEQIGKRKSGRSGQKESPPMADLPRNVIILDSTCAEGQFNNLCTENKSLNIHLLQKEHGRYIWMKSRGNIAHLVEHRDCSETDDSSNDRIGATCLSDDKLIAHDEPVIISDAAGAGKSTMLSYVASKIKENKPDILVLKINLNHHATALAEVKKTSSYDLGSINGAVRFLMNEVLSCETDLARNVFKRIMEEKRKVALVIDGFDEISPTYESPVIDLLQTLADYGIKKLVVATRPHTRAALETKLNTFSYEIQPFSTSDQERFFTEFWKTKFQGSHYNSQQMAENKTRRVQKYTTAMMIELANSITDPRNKFTGIPLQAKLLAEIFEEHSEGAQEHFNSCKEFIHSEVDEPKFPEKINLIYLFENFVEKKFDVFFKKRGGNLTDVAVMEDRRQRYKSFLETHERLALDTLFDKDKITELLNSQRDVSYRSFEPTDPEIPVERDGIITQFIDGQPRFGHRTYAEYFAAKFFSDMLKKRQQAEPLAEIFVADILLGENYKTVRAFINWLLPNDYVALLQGEFWTRHLKTSRSKWQETIVHVAAAEGNDRIIRLFLDCLYSNTEDLKNLVNVKDIFGRTTLHRAVEYGHLDKIKLLVENTDVELDARNISGFTPLHQAALTANLDVIKYLIDKGANINCRTNDGVTPLHLAAPQGQQDKVEYLLEKGADIACRREDGMTPLHLAARQGQKNIVEYLLEKGADIDCQRRDGMTPLHLASRQGQEDIVLDLLKNGAEINSRTNDGMTPLYLAARHGQQGIIEYLLGMGADINCQTSAGLTPLHVAALEGKLVVLQYLLDKGADINCRTNLGWTPLQLAAEASKPVVLVRLLENGADINCQMNDGITLLHLAVQQDKLDVVQYLHQHGADIDCQANDGITLLHLAAEEGKLDVIQYLHRKGAVINCETNLKWTPLHLAAQEGKLDVVQYLHQNGADINCRTNLGWTPLHLAAEEGKLDVAEYLHRNGADINCQANDGMTLLHRAAEKGKLDVAQYLHQNGADINCQMNLGWTPLHLAAQEGKLDVVKYLHQNGADINCQTNDGVRPLLLAAENGKLKVVEYLHQNAADVDCKTNGGVTPLHQAARGGKLDVVKYLYQNGANINCQRDDGARPLHLAALEGKLDVVQYLHLAGADINCQTNYGARLLHLAAHEGKLDVVEYLHQNGADINCRTNDGWTPLHLAAEDGQLNVVKYLHQNEADINSRTNDGRTPLHQTAQEGKLDVTEYLHQNGADINCQMSNGIMPLHLAAIQGKLNLVEYLHQNGADINCQTNDGVTSLHLAMCFGKLDVVKYLRKNEVDITC